MKKRNWDTIKFLITEKGSPIKDLLVTIALRAKNKNDYYVGPIMSNDNGIIEVTQQELESEIKKAQSNFIMDYAADLSDCKNIELIIDDIKTLKKQAEAIADWYPDNANKLQKLIKKCVNARHAKLHIHLGLDFEETIRIELNRCSDK